MKKINISIAIIEIFFYFPLFAQTDSLSHNKQILARQIINLNFPRTRNLDVQLETSYPGEYNIKMPEYNYNEKGTMNSAMAVKINGNFFLLREGKFSLSGGASYRYYNMRFKDASNTITGENIYHNLQEDFHVFGVNSTIGYGTLLFKKDIVLTGTIFSEFSPEKFELWAGIITATVVLKNAKNEMLSVGVSGFTHHMSIFPVLPIVTYMKRMSPTWILDCSLPGYCYIRCLFEKQGRLSTGVNLDSNHFFIHPSSENKSVKELYFVKNEAKLNVMYEHQILKHLFFTIKSGCSFPFNCKLYDSDKLMRNALGKYKEHPNFFMNIGVSYNL